MGKLKKMIKDKKGMSYPLTVAMVIGRLGVTFVAANAITSVTQQLSTVMIQGVCQAGAIVTGQTLGEGKQEQAQSQAYRFLGLGLGLGMLSAFFIMAVSPAIIGSYKVSEETAEVAAQLMHAISLILIFQATNSIMTKGVLRGGGDTKMLMLADNLFLWVVSIPLGMLAGFVFHFPAFWIYVCLKADQILKAVWCVFRLRSGKWMKKITVGKMIEVLIDRSVNVPNILKLKDYLLITGPAGVGKTKFSLELASNFQKENPKYIIKYIRNNNQLIWEDLKVQIVKDKKYLIVVDDANKLRSNLSAIVNFKDEFNQGSIKIILTVRNYLKKEVENELKNFEEIELNNFDKTELATILQSPDYNITNYFNC
jgi:hypothetical protein